MKHIKNYLKSIISWIAYSKLRMIIVALLMFIGVFITFTIYPEAAMALLLACIVVYYLALFGYVGYNAVVYVQQELCEMFPKLQRYEYVTGDIK